MCGSTSLGIVYDTAKPLISCLPTERIANLRPPVEESASQEQKCFEANYWYCSLVLGEGARHILQAQCLHLRPKKNAALGGVRITVPTRVPV